MQPIISNRGLSAAISLQHQRANPELTCKYSKQEHTASLLPRKQSREQQRLEIIQAVKEGSLSLRVVSPDSEKVYPSQKRKDPRPVFLIQEGIPVKMRSLNNTLGIQNPETLIAYKRNAYTKMLVEPETALEKFNQKCLPTQHELQEKMREQAERYWEIYPRFTSGHLQADGTFKAPKLKFNDPYHAGSSIPYSELLTIGYEADQIKCYVVPKEQLNLNITDILKEKRALENTLGIGALPLAVHCEKNGAVEVYFDEELDGEQLEFHERQLNHFAVSRGIDPIRIR